MEPDTEIKMASNTATEDSYSIHQAAELLGVSPKTVRKYIKAGKIPAEKIMGKFGEEYRITQIPENLGQLRNQPTYRSMSARALYEENIKLAAQLGQALERIRHLTEQMKLLQAPKMPWWRRLLRR